MKYTDIRIETLQPVKLLHSVFICQAPAALSYLTINIKRINENNSTLFVANDLGDAGTFMKPLKMPSVDLTGRCGHPYNLLRITCLNNNNNNIIIIIIIIIINSKRFKNIPTNVWLVL